MKGHSTSNAGKPIGGQVRCLATLSGRILVVDDDLILRQFSTTVLAHSGYQVDTAEDGQTAWEALHVKDYDLLITDNNMPKVSGVELVKMLRYEDLALPVILVSGAMPTEELNRYPWLQLAATLQKPFTPDELLKTVKRVLRENGSVREQRELLPDRQSQPSANVLRR